MTPAHILVALWGTSALGLAWLIFTAPEGWEDRGGLHLGRQRFDDAGDRHANRDGFHAPVPFHSNGDTA